MVNINKLNKHASILIFHCWNKEMDSKLVESIIAILDYALEKDELNLSKVDLHILNEIKVRIPIAKRLKKIFREDKKNENL